MAVDKPAKVASQLISILKGDIEKLTELDDYHKGCHRGPYVPENADAEYRMLAERCITNWMPLLVRTPAQAMYVDGFSYSEEAVEDGTENLAWEHWQRSGLDGRQSALYEGAFALGHAFTVVEKSAKKRDEGKSVTRLLSALRTSAAFRDPVNDIAPTVALHVEYWPTDNIDGKSVPGTAVMWDDECKYVITFDAEDDIGKRKLSVMSLGKHGATECPVTRFAAAVDLEGRTVGIIEPMIPVQDRINQTIFDLLMVQTNGSFNIRWVTGMAPPLRKRVIYLKDDDGEIVEDADGQPIIEDIVDELDKDGRPIPEDIELSTKRFLFAEDADAKFGTLQGTPLDGYINSIDMSIRHLAMLSQTPPTHMMGSIVNLSAEAMAAAEVALTRKVQAFKTNFGECWERNMNLVSEIDGEGVWDESMEVQWRDMEGQSFAKTADALLKLKEIGVPKIGLWGRIPGVTATELQEWKLIEQNDPAQILASAIAQPRGQVANSSPETMMIDEDLE